MHSISDMDDDYTDDPREHHIAIRNGYGGAMRDGDMEMRVLGHRGDVVDDGHSAPSSSSSPPSSSSNPNDIPLEGSWTWNIVDFPTIQAKCNSRFDSEPFWMCGLRWRLLLYPNGHDKAPEHVSCYLKIDMRMDQGTAFHFRIIALHPTDPSKNKIHKSHFNFRTYEDDQGFPKFLSTVELFDFIHNEKNHSLIITVEVWRQSSKWNLQYGVEDSPTGYQGLKNQGATCYMNSFLQTVFHLPNFRQFVYTMPTDNESSSVGLALQRVLWSLQTSETAVSTKQLTAAFGWDSANSFVQHDVQEFARVLIDNLDEKMKKTNTKINGVTVSSLFEGKMSNFIECINVPYKSQREEAFLDLAMNVKGCGSLAKSFEQYTDVEKLEGKNQYRAESYGSQDANKGIRFISFPPILQLQLKRFEYDPYSDQMKKINERFEFPTVLDLSKYIEHTKKDGESSPPRAIYALHSVLVHSGGSGGGHYYNFIRPFRKRLPSQLDLSPMEFYSKCPWIKFNDEMVTEVKEEVAVEGNYGDPSGHKASNAYMLVYVDESLLNVMNEQVLELTEEEEKGKDKENEIEGDKEKEKEKGNDKKDEVKSISPSRFIFDVPVPPAVDSRFHGEVSAQRNLQIQKERAYLYQFLHIMNENALMSSPLKDCCCGTEFSFSVVSRQESEHQVINTMSFETPSQSLSVLKGGTFESTIPDISKACGIPLNNIEIWKFSSRDYIARPSALLWTPNGRTKFATQTVEEIHGGYMNDPITLYVREAPQGSGSSTALSPSSGSSSSAPPPSNISPTSPPPSIDPARSFIALKFFDPLEQRLIFLGTFGLPPDCRIADVIVMIKERIARQLGWGRGRVAAIREIARRREQSKMQRVRMENSFDVSASQYTEYLMFDSDPKESSISRYNQFESAIHAEIIKFTTQLSAPALQSSLPDFNVHVWEDERVRNSRLPRLLSEQWVSDCKLINGSILVAQIAFPPAEMILFRDLHTCRYHAYEEHIRSKLSNNPIQTPFHFVAIPCGDFHETASDLLRYVVQRQSVRFRRIPWTANPPKDRNPNFEFTLELNHSTLQPTILQRVASIISLDDYTRIQLHKHSSYTKTVDYPVDKYLMSQNPQMQPLSDMIDRMEAILYYSLLDFSANELRNNFYINAIYGDVKLSYSIHRELVPKTTTFRHLQEQIQRKLYPNVKVEEFPACRRMWIHYDYSSRRSEFSLDDYLSHWRSSAIVNPDAPILIEEIPHYEATKDRTDTISLLYRYIPGTLTYQYTFYSVPFTMLIKEGESAPDFFVRLKQRLGIDGPPSASSESPTKDVEKDKELPSKPTDTPPLTSSQPTTPSSPPVDRLRGFKFSRLTHMTYYDIGATPEMRTARDRRQQMEKAKNMNMNTNRYGMDMDDDVLAQINDIEEVDMDWGMERGRKEREANKKEKDDKEKGKEERKEKETDEHEKDKGENGEAVQTSDKQVPSQDGIPAKESDTSPDKPKDKESEHPPLPQPFVGDEDEYPYLLINDHHTFALAVYDPFHVSQWEKLTGQTVTMKSQNNFSYFHSTGQDKVSPVTHKLNKSQSIKIYNKE